MLQKEYSIEIKAPANQIWFALWDDYHYRKWTAVFSEGSYAKTAAWKEGTKVHFLTPEGKGMYSVVTTNKPDAEMCFTHIGQIKNFEEQPLDEETKAWSGGKERYLLSHKDGITTLIAQLDVFESFLAYFDATFPNALAAVKELAENINITIEATINNSIESVWEKWTNPADIMNWNAASDDWHTPKSENNFIPGGKFKHTMSAKDGSFSFDLEGTYTNIDPLKKIEYTLADNRKVSVIFEDKDNGIFITQQFEPENENSLELQRMGWQAILNNFKKYVEQA